MAINSLPQGCTSVTPYLIVSDTVNAIRFYEQLFGAKEILRLDGPNGKTWHAEIQIGNARIMLADEFPEMGIIGSASLGGSGVNLLIYVDDVDAVYAQVLAAGGTKLHPVQDQFYGDRSGMLRDPYGHIWSIATHKEDLSNEEISRRSQALLAKMEQS